MINKNFRYIFAVLIILVFSSVALAGVPVEVFVGKGTIVTLKEPSKRVSISDPEIADLNLISPTEVVINGKKLGSTNLIVWDKQGKATFFDITVIGDIDLKKLESQIKEVAPNDNINVEFAKDTIVLSGKASNQQTIDKVVQLAQSYAIGSAAVTSTSRDAAGVVTTTTKTSGKVLNHIIIENAQQVLLEVKVAQVDKTKLKDMGIGYIIKNKNFDLTGPGLFAQPEGSIGNAVGLTDLGDAVGTEIGPGVERFAIQDVLPQIGFAHFPSDIGIILKALSSKGYAKVLAEPNLIVRSGERGNFHVGTRFPVQSVSGIGAEATISIIYEEVGIRINFAPEVLETGAIRLKIDPAEVSNITDFVRLQNLVAPIIDTRTVKTSVDLKEGESLVLAGLLTDETKKNIQKIPLLGDIPIFGALFRSTSEELKEKELVFFITPKMIKPTPPGQKTELPTDKVLTPDQEREFNWIPVPKENATFER
jgi:pilus assembly protein CpaC